MHKRPREEEEGKTGERTKNVHSISFVKKGRGAKMHLIMCLTQEYLVSRSLPCANKRICLFKTRFSIFFVVFHAS